MNDVTKYDVAVASSHASIKWKNKQFTWAEFVSLFREPTRTKETVKEFLLMSREDQSRAKDVGAFMCGMLSASKRLKRNVMHRSMLCLDIDFGTLSFYGSFVSMFPCASFIHGTHKHTEASPRFRLILPLSREVTPEEYEAVGRKVADIVGFELFDKTTFQPERCMFWPSIPCDATYYFEETEGEPLDADDILGMYADWQDVTKWNLGDTDTATCRSLVKEQQNPLDKSGMIGAFCKAYTITEAIGTFLSDVYSRVDDCRYTFANGSTTGGAIVYDDLFIYSHHGTDPLSNGHVHNAYDMVRIHKFGYLDNKESAAKSTEAMNDFIKDDKGVKSFLAQANEERAMSLMSDFQVIESEEVISDEETIPTELFTDWVRDRKGVLLPVSINFRMAFKHDKGLKSLIAQDKFQNKTVLLRTPSWREANPGDDLQDVDFAAIRTYIETKYEISNSKKVDDAILMEAEDNSFHPVRTYIDGLIWDGVSRVDQVLPYYMGAENNAYTREAFRIMMVGAVARVFNPGVKFDTALIMYSAQGAGKSTLIKQLGKNWFSDSLSTVEGTKAFEQLQGKWILELAELSAMKRAEVEATKNFITKREDTYRPAYGRVTVNYKRQCVFFGTTNKADFLKDSSGNRRFMPVVVRANINTSMLFEPEFEYTVNQLWAEAKAMYDAGVSIRLSDEAEALANDARDAHFEEDDRQGVLENYLNRPIPSNWYEMDSESRRDFINMGGLGTIKRDKVTVIEIAIECFGIKKSDIDVKVSNDIKNMLNRVTDWERCTKETKFDTGIYGAQRYYFKVVNEDEEVFF